MHLALFDKSPFYGIQLNGSWRGMESYWKDKNKKIALTGSYVDVNIERSMQRTTSIRTHQKRMRTVKICGKVMSVVSGEMCSFSSFFFWFFLVHVFEAIQSGSEWICVDSIKGILRLVDAWQSHTNLKSSWPCLCAKARVIFTSVETFIVCCRCILLFFSRPLFYSCWFHFHLFTDIKCWSFCVCTHLFLSWSLLGLLSHTLQYSWLGATCTIVRKHHKKNKVVKFRNADK